MSDNPTGRNWRKDPPLQNIPIRTELGRELRKMFLPDNPPFPDVDFSKIENRIAEQLKKEGKDPYGR